MTGVNLIAQKLIACGECDALYRRISLNTECTAFCTRCGAELFRSPTFRLDTLLALTLGSLVVFLIANTFPLVTLAIKGIHHEATLLGAIVTLYREGMPIVSGFVLMVTILFPLVELMALLYLLLPLRQGRRPAQFRFSIRVVHAVRPWGMIEVFVLGVLIALVKLSTVGNIVPGIALWAFGALTVLLAALLMVDARCLWDFLEERAGGYAS